LRGACPYLIAFDNNLCQWFFSFFRLNLLYHNCFWDKVDFLNFLTHLIESIARLRKPAWSNHFSTDGNINPMIAIPSAKTFTVTPAIDCF
jgi:hypothetical protein